MKTFIRWIGYLLLVYVIAIFGFNGELQVAYDVPSIAMVIGGTLAVLLAGMDKDFWPALRVWNLRDDADPARVVLLDRLCGLGMASAWILGVFAFFAGLVIMLAWGVENAEKFKAGSAIALLTILYGALLALFFRLHQTRVRRWLDKRERSGAGKHTSGRIGSASR